MSRLVSPAFALSESTSRSSALRDAAAISTREEAEDMPYRRPLKRSETAHLNEQFARCRHRHSPGPWSFTISTDFEGE